MSEAVTISSPQTESTKHSAAGDMAAQSHKKETLQERIQPFSIQAKLTVGAPDDPYEKEADAVADKVMRMPEHSFLQKKNEAEGNKTLYKKTEEDKDRKVALKREPGTSFIQTKQAVHENESTEKIAAQPQPITSFIQAKSHTDTQVSDSLASSIEGSRGNGAALDTSTQAFMGQQMGADFSRVKIHTGNESVQMNRELNAQAFTVGNDVYFNEGKYQPQNSEGKQLLAHELTHVVQQAPAIQSKLIQRKLTGETQNTTFSNIHSEAISLGQNDNIQKDESGQKLSNHNFKRQHAGTPPDDPYENDNVIEKFAEIHSQSFIQRKQFSLAEQKNITPGILNTPGSAAHSGLLSEFSSTREAGFPLHSNSVLNNNLSNKLEAKEKHKSEINAQIDKEVNRIPSKLQVKARKTEGKPTVLLPERERNPKERKTELNNKGQVLHQQKIPAQPHVATNQKNNSAPGGTKRNKASLTKKTTSQTGGVESINEKLNFAKGLPPLETDPGIRGTQVLNAAKPSEPELENNRLDTRRKAEKTAEQLGYVVRFGEQATASKTRTREAVSVQRNLIQSQKNRIKALVTQQTQAKITELHTQTANHKLLLNEQYVAAHTELLIKKENDLARVEEIRTAKTEELHSALTNSKEAFIAFVNEQKQMPYTRAEAEAGRADAELDAAANECYRHSDQVAGRYPGSEDDNPDARESVHELAIESASDILGKKPVIRQDLLERAQDFHGGFDQYQQDTIQQVDGVEQQLAPAITDAAQQFHGTINQLYEHIQTSLAAKKEHQSIRLNDLEQQTIHQLQQNKEQVVQTVNSIAASSVQQLEASEQHIIRSIETFKQNTLTVLSPDGSEPYLPGIRLTYEENSRHLAQLETDGSSQIQLFSTETSVTLESIAASGQTQRGGMLEQANSNSTRVLSENLNTINESKNSLTQKIEQAFTGFSQSLDQMREDALAGLEQSIQERRNNITQANREFGEELVKQVNTSIETAKQPLLDPLLDRLYSAADKAKASWWEGVLTAIGDLLIGLIILVVIAAILVAAGVFSTIAGALLVIGLLVLAVVFISSLVGRLMQGQGWMSIPLALADSVGITALYQGIRNKDIATGQDLHLSEYERWNQGTTGFLQVVLILSPLRSRIPGIRRVSLPEIPGLGRFFGWAEEAGAGRIRGRQGWIDNPAGYQPPGDSWFVNPLLRFLPGFSEVPAGRFTKPTPPPAPETTITTTGAPAEVTANASTLPLPEKTITNTSTTAATPEIPAQTTTPPVPDNTATPTVPAPRTEAELRTDLNPALRTGETTADAARRIETARIELEHRRIFGTYEALGEAPDHFDIATNDAMHPDAHTLGSSTNPGRHNPAIPLERSVDSTGAPDGTRTIEGRVLGDPPWPERVNFSGRWRSIEIINRVLNSYLRANWENIKSDLATNGAHTGVFPAAEVVGDGYYNKNYGTGNPPQAVGPVPTNMVRVTFLLIPGTPPTYYVITCFPTISGM